MSNTAPQVNESAKQAKANATELVIGEGKSEVQSPAAMPPAGPREPSSLAQIAKKVSVPPAPSAERPAETASPTPEEPVDEKIRVYGEGGNVVLKLPVKGRGVVMTPDQAMHMGNQMCRTAENIKAGIIQE